MRQRKDLRDYQEKAVSFIKDTKTCALWVDMGLGKTVSTLTAIAELFDDFAIAHVLVVAPKLVAEETWLEEVNNWAHTQHLSVAVAVGTERQRVSAINQRAHITCINRENVQWLIDKHVKTSRKRWHWDMLVIDESSSFKNPNAKRFRALKKIVNRDWIEYIVQLTGTPASNGYLNIWSQIYLLDKGKRLFKNYTSYKDVYFRPDYMGFNYDIREGSEKRIHEKIADKVLVLREQDYLDLPEFVSVTHTVGLDHAQFGRYKELTKDFILSLEDGEIIAQNAASLYGKLCQFATGDCYDEDKRVIHVHDEKIKTMEGIVEELNGQTLLVAYCYQHERDKIMKKFGSKVRVLKTKEDIQDWKAGKILIGLAHPQSIGHGLNLQDGGNNLLWYSTPSDLEIYLQFNKRLHRSGQTKPVFAHHLITEDTIEETVVKPRIAEKDNNQRALIDSVLRYANAIKS